MGIHNSVSWPEFGQPDGFQTQLESQSKFIGTLQALFEQERKKNEELSLLVTKLQQELESLK
jgi:hypothetical protein